jgi:hypothetical protein
MAKKPLKPTEAFGPINFGKDGSVKKQMLRLSSQKEDQEIEALEYFVQGLKDVHLGPVVFKIQKLPENDQDFCLYTSLGLVTVQLTELVERDFSKELSRYEYNSGRYNRFILHPPNRIPWAVDTELRDSALIRLIEKKIDKKYSKANKEILWLVIFTTSSYFLTEYSEGGIQKKSMSLILAQKYLGKLSNCVFDQIWFTNLQTRPVCIWRRKIR